NDIENLFVAFERRNKIRARKFGPRPTEHLSCNFKSPLPRSCPSRPRERQNPPPAPLSLQTRATAKPPQESQFRGLRCSAAGLACSCSAARYQSAPESETCLRAFSRTPTSVPDRTAA